MPRRALLSAAALAALGWVLLCAVRHARRETACAMTWSAPAYVAHAVVSRVRHYRLWRYAHAGAAPGNGSWALPVVFVPGHAGSHMQGRSLCSALAERDAAAHVDCWLIDFNEERTALLGHAMWRQSEFINDAVAALRATYTPAAPGAAPPAVAIVAHSLGGAVARGALTAPNHVRGSIDTIVTLGTPHTAAPVRLDAEASRFYAAINGDLRAAQQRALQQLGAAPCRTIGAGGSGGGGVCSAAAAAAGAAGTTSAFPEDELQRVALLSLSSGPEDTQVWEPLSVLPVVPDVLPAGVDHPAAAAAHRRLPIAWLSSSRLPRGGVTISHERTVWCRQLVVPLAEALVLLAERAAQHRATATLAADAAAAGAHARLRALLESMGPRGSLVEDEGGEATGDDARASSSPGGRVASTLAAVAWWPTAWLFLAPAERAPRLAGEAASAATAEAYVAGTVVRYGPALVVAAVVVCMLAVSATAAAEARRMHRASGAGATAASPLVPAATAGSGVDGGAFAPEPLVRAIALPARFASRAAWRCSLRARRSQLTAAGGLVAAVRVAGPAVVALWLAGLPAASALWSTVVSPPVPVGITALCLCVALGVLDAAARIAGALCRLRSGCAPAAAAAAAAADAAAPCSRRRLLLLHSVLCALLAPTWLGSLHRLGRAALGGDVSFLLPREARTMAADAAWVAAAACVLLQLTWRGGGGGLPTREPSKPPAPPPATPNDSPLARALLGAVLGSRRAEAASAAVAGRPAALPHPAPGRPAAPAAPPSLDAAAAPPPHGACPDCLHEDGGRGALLVETLGLTQRVAPGVWLGPAFRVVACDCWEQHAQCVVTPIEAAALRAALCAFCSCECPACGGSPQAAQWRAAASDGVGAAGAATGARARLLTLLRALLSPARWLLSGTGYALLDASTVAVAYAAAALVVAVCCAGDAAHARDVVVTVAAACSGCSVSLMRAPQRRSVRAHDG